MKLILLQWWCIHEDMKKWGITVLFDWDWSKPSDLVLPFFLYIFTLKDNTNRKVEIYSQESGVQELYFYQGIGNSFASIYSKKGGETYVSVGDCKSNDRAKEWAS